MPVKSAWKSAASAPIIESISSSQNMLRNEGAPFRHPVLSKLSVCWGEHSRIRRMIGTGTFTFFKRRSASIDNKNFLIGSDNENRRASD